MYWWKLSKTLSNPNDPDWDLLTKLTLGEKIHPQRKRTFLLSREALRVSLKEAGKEVAISMLMLKDYSGIRGVPEYTLSLSHSKDCGAALVAPGCIYRSVGIDIEHTERTVKKSIIERVGHPEDLGSLRNIELWALKEAVFKALMNSGSFEKHPEFSSIKIGKDFWSHPPSGLRGDWELKLSDDMVTALAFLKN